MKMLLTFIAGLIAAYIALWNSERRITVENITKERAKWRDKIREISKEIHSAIIDNADDSVIDSLRNELRLHLNPGDDQDNKILELVASGDTDQANSYSKSIAYLLKHDWERAKLESKPLILRLKVFHTEESSPPKSSNRFIARARQYFYYPKRGEICEPSQNS